MSDPHYVLDSSAVLANLLSEPRAEFVESIMRQALISAVNLAEIVAKLQEGGLREEEVDSAVEALNLRVVPFDADQAMRAGKLRASTRVAGLSLGDRACLALAISENATAVTMDRAWATIELPVPVLLARP